MRLIDADELFENLDGMMAVSPTGYIHGDTVADMISDAPTVDAVPIEWLIRQKNKHNNDGFAWIFEAVMEDWRKDNEID